MPAEQWNGKFMGVGNGGWSGRGRLPGPGHGVDSRLCGGLHQHRTRRRRRYVCPGGTPKSSLTFGYRAVHEMTMKGKAIAEAFYSKGPQRSYWNGCSSGGKQGLKEAQKFPLDYDGIVAGAPANYWTHLMIGDLWPAVVTHKDPAAALSPANLDVLHQAALAACDSLDGVKDGLIDDPARCHFDRRGALQGRRNRWLPDCAAGRRRPQNLRRSPH